MPADSGLDGAGIEAGALQAIKYTRGALQLLDQRLLPLESVYLDIADCETAFAAIKDMAVRGAPAIAISAALALAVELAHLEPGAPELATAAAAAAFVARRLDFLEASRPTAVNLAEACARLKSLAVATVAAPASTGPGVTAAVLAAAESMLSDDVAANRALGAFGAAAVLAAVASRRAAAASSPVAGIPPRPRIGPVRVLTHCNTGSLATAAYGTALGVVRSLHSSRDLAKAYCTETRPYDQGARLTAYELVHEGIDATLIVDSAAASLMASGAVDAVIVGADRVVANGDTANKIGTLSLALGAAAAGVPFFVAAPTTTLDGRVARGGDIHIEQRPAREVTHRRYVPPGGGPAVEVQTAAPGIAVWNPSFDVTPAHLITAIITESGVMVKPAGAAAFDVPAFLAAHAPGRASHPTPTAAPAVAPHPAFVALSDAGVMSYLADRPNLATMLGGTPADWSCREVGDGNINYVYIVTGPAGSLVAKQALPYVRCVGQSWPLTPDRAAREAAALIAHRALCPAHVPAVHAFDADRAIIVMAYVQPPAEILRYGLTRGVVYPHLADHVSTYLAQTLFGTSAMALGVGPHHDASESSRNDAMCGLTEQVVFGDPYTQHHNNRCSAELVPVAEALRADAALKAAVALLHLRFVSCPQALLHGDLHTGSIMASPGGQTVVIDPEFAFYGPMGFDLGALVANLLLAFFASDGHEAVSGAGSREGHRSFLLGAAAAVADGFASKFRALWTARVVGSGAAGGGEMTPTPPGTAPALFGPEAAGGASAMGALQDAFLAGVWADAVGYAGAKMVRRLVGIAHVHDMESIADEAARAGCERRALSFGRKLVLEAGAFTTPRRLVDEAAKHRAEDLAQRG